MTTRRAFIGTLAGGLPFALGAGAFLAGTGGLLLAAPLAADAQQPSKVYRVGMLSSRPVLASPETDPLYGAFFRRMRELGYVPGGNVSYEWRFADGKYDRLPGLAAELVGAKVDVILAMAPPSVQAAKQATAAIPIVMVSVGDPVALGFVASLPRPSGNITGVTNAIDDTSGKYLELLRLAVPKLSRVAALVNTENPNYLNIFAQAQSSAKAMAIKAWKVEAATPDQIAEGFQAMRQARAGALIVPGDPLFFNQRRQIVDLAIKARIPTIPWRRDLAEAGALMSYGSKLDDDYRNAANLVDKILKGTNPRNLPVEQSTKFELVINLKTAKAIGLTIPPALLGRADEVIQ